MPDPQNQPQEEEDLEGGPVGPPPPDPVRQLKADQGWLQELMRSYISLALFALLAFTIVWGFLKSGTDDWPQTKDLLEMIIPAEVSLLGSAVGFYFGRHHH